MLELATPQGLGTILCSARLRDHDAGTGCWNVALGDEEIGSARVAMRPVPRLGLGQEVLVAGNDPDNLYIIGLLDGPAANSEIRMANGARAELDGMDEDERLRVHDANGALVFEYDPQNQVTKLHIPEGDLSIASSGSINLDAADAVNIKGRGAVYVESEQAVRVGTLAGGLDINRDVVALRGRLLSLVSEIGVLEIDRLRLEGQQLRAKLDEARTTIGRVEVVADVIRSKARQTYQDVEGLVQTRAGRVRTLVEGALTMKSRYAILKAATDFKVNARQILLG